MTKIAVIGSEQSGRTTLASKLGKKGNVSDITMYDFEKGTSILTTVDATGYPKSIKPLITALNLTDAVLLCIPPAGLDTYTGECIVALDLLGCKHGIVVLTKSDTTYPNALDELKQTIKKITTSTVLKDWDQIAISTTTFEGMEELKEMITLIGKKVDVELAQLDELPPRVIIDHVFNVTGIGCVVLGIVDQGTIHAKDKMTMMPVEKTIEIRSIQMHDINVKSAAAGARVGLALKNIQSKDVDRGYVISNNETVTMDFILNCTISQFTKQVAVGDILHLFTGLQSAPARVKKIMINNEVVEYARPGSECILTLSGSKNIAYIKSDRFIITNLDEKQRFVGYGFLEQNPR
ncbi:MAG: elongation factor Tu [Methanosarcinales archaeon]|nr:elongation factor Tu [Methanosarcinales archaeon]